MSQPELAGSRVGIWPKPRSIRRRIAIRSKSYNLHAVLASAAKVHVLAEMQAVVYHGNNNVVYHVRNDVG